MKAVLVRTEEDDECVRGILACDGVTWATLERPWRHNVRNVSCIPAGQYKAAFLAASASGRYRAVYHLRPVRDRSGILIHQGNTVNHTRGCILIGKRKGRLAGKKAVLNSKSALRELNEVVGKEDFELTIIGGQHA